MSSFIVALSAFLIVCLLYIRKLHKRLAAYEKIWQEIESIADRNEDGTFTINIQHLEEHPYQLHASSAPSSGVRLMELDGFSSRSSHGFDPRAA